MTAHDRLISDEAVATPGREPPDLSQGPLPSRFLRAQPFISRSACAVLALATADLVALAASLLLIQPSVEPVGAVPEIMFLVGFGLALTALAGLYRREAWEADELGRIAGVAAIFAALVASTVSKNIGTFAVILCAVGLGMSGLRMLLRSLPITSSLMRQTMVVVGLGMELGQFAYQMRASRSGAPNVLQGAPAQSLVDLGPIGFDRWLRRVARRASVPVQSLQVVLLPARREAAAARRLGGWLAEMRQPCGIATELGQGVGQVLVPRKLMRSLGADIVVAEVSPPRRGHSTDWLKRALDISLTIVALLLLAPLFTLVLAGLAREGGPWFFCQRRVGRGGRRFTCYKFRTMRPDAEDRLALLLDCNPAAKEEWDRHQKLSDDPRVTRLGAVLRASSLDELPQLLNVLRGDMSLVGPRPIIAPEVPGYAADHAYFTDIAFADYASCVPGLTGLWQVCGRHRTSHAERIRLDRWYARHRSIWLDLVILARTIRVVLVRDGR